MFSSDDSYDVDTYFVSVNDPGEDSSVDSSDVDPVVDPEVDVEVDLEVDFEEDFEVDFDVDVEEVAVVVESEGALVTSDAPTFAIDVVSASTIGFVL